MSNKSVLSIKSFDDTIFDDIFENQNHEGKEKNTDKVKLHLL